MQTPYPEAGREIRLASAADQAKLIDTLARAFVDDPMYDWLVSGDKPRLRALFAAYLSHLALPHNETYMNADGLGAMLWSPPGNWDMGLGMQLRFLPDWLGVVGLRALWSRWRGIELTQKHHPHEPHWYLMVIGIAPEAQGQGRATRLLQPMLDRCDRSGMPAYLETATPSNLPLYRRYGFEVREELRIPGGPVLWTMWREPRQPV